MKMRWQRLCLRKMRELGWRGGLKKRWRSEEHTSELQSLTNIVCRLLLEKKKANSFQALASAGSRMPRAYRITIRKSAAISERAEMKVIGGIEPRRLLVRG